jgi:hypothetical protein
MFGVWHLRAKDRLISRKSTSLEWTRHGPVGGGAFFEIRIEESHPKRRHLVVDRKVPCEHQRCGRAAWTESRPRFTTKAMYAVLEVDHDRVVRQSWFPSKVRCFCTKAREELRGRPTTCTRL